MTTYRETTTVREYTLVIGRDGWGDAGDDEVTRDEHRAACERAQEFCTVQEGPEISITVRPARHGEIAGVYDGDQLLGYSVECPDDIEDLTNRAWVHACETWPVPVS